MMISARSVHRRAHWPQERFPDAVLRDHQAQLRSSGGVMKRKSMGCRGSDASICQEAG